MNAKATNETHAARVLLEALQAIAEDPETRRRIDNGSLHEDQLVIALGTLAEMAGCQVTRRELVSCSYPFEQDLGDGPKPKDYRTSRALLLEVDGQLLHLGYGPPLAKRWAAGALAAFHYDNPQAVIDQGGKGAPILKHHQWQAWQMEPEALADFWMEGLDAIRPVVDCNALQATLARARMEQQTAEPVETVRTRSVRL